jgi:protein SCO1
MASLKTKWLVGILACFLTYGIAVANTPQLTGTVLDKPKPIHDFNLKKTDGSSFTTQSFKNHWTLLFFGFTRCGYVCPTSLAALKQVYETVQPPKPQVIFVSIDPDRDDLARIQHYVTSFNKNFIGATGSKAELNTLTSQLGILYMKIVPAKEKGKASTNYDIDHSGSILLVDPEGNLIAVFSMPHHAESIASDYQVITRK